MNRAELRQSCSYFLALFCSEFSAFCLHCTPNSMQYIIKIIPKIIVKTIHKLLTVPDYSIRVLAIM